MRIFSNRRNKDDDVADEFQDLVQDVCVTVYSFVKLISDLQEYVAKIFIEEYGVHGPIDLNSLPKMARIMSKYAAADSLRKLRNYPKSVQKQFNTWQCLRKKAMSSSKSEKLKLAVIPAKLCFFYFYNGELCKAIVCLLDYVKLIPDDILATEAAIRWLMFLGETELLKRKMKTWNMDNDSRELWKATRAAISYIESKDTRGETLEKLVGIRDKIRKENIKTFPKFELSSYVHWMCSTMCNVSVNSNLVASEFPDRLSQLQEASAKADSIMRNRIPGLAAYQFDNSTSSSIWPFLEGNRPGSATDYINLGSTIAWHFEMRREWALVNVTTAQGRSSMCAMILNLRIALKSASFFRIIQAANIMTYFSMIIEEPGSEDNMKLMKASSLNLISADSIKSEIREQKTSAHFDEEDDMTMIQQVDNLSSDLDIDHLFHPITHSCGCNVCLQYPTSSTFAAEYMFAYCIHSDFSQNSMEHFNKEFVCIRERDMRFQALMHRDDLRPRPNAIQSEIFGLCTIQWLIRKIDAGEPFDNASRDIYKNSLRIAKYLQTRMIDQILAVKQLGRQLEYPQNVNYSWMQPVRKNWTKLGIDCDADFFRAVPQFGPKPIVHQDDLEAIQTRIREEMNEYTHILYRDWRSRIFPYIGRTFTCPWEAAYAWAESTFIGSRNAVQLRLERCHKGLVTISGPDHFRNCVEAMPTDMTLVQFAMADNKHIYLIKLHADREPIIMPIAHYSQASELMDKFTHLLDEDELICSCPGNMSATMFWERRRFVDARLASFVGEVEKNFLGVSAHLLRPSDRLGPESDILAEKIARISKGGLRIEESKELVYLAQFMNASSWRKLVLRFCEMRTTDAVFPDYLPTFHSVALDALKNDRTATAQEPSNKKYTYLVVCPQLSQFCWERLPIFNDFPYVCRQVSIHSMFSQLEALRNQERQLPLQIDMKNAYYLLDQGNNLCEKKNPLLDYINKFKWEGKIGGEPDSTEMATALEEYDAFFYFGHGSSSSVMPTSLIKNAKCNAISLLMGGGSVKTIPQAHGFDGKSVLLDYAMAKCPLIVGCLWTVTDGELYRFLMRMIDDCFEKTRNVIGVDKLRQLAEAMHEARSNARLKYLTGAAIVMYGFPVVSKPVPVVVDERGE
uniref:separase n=1 Tax=Caenorhabditis japonica TaxID=281687 RepID=A0A8R1DL09_CAEJA